jgi:hypothetical protein
MSRLSKWQADALPDEDFAILTQGARLCPVLDHEDAKHAWSRASFSGDPAGVRRRVIDICLKKGIRLTPAMGAQAIAEEVAAHNERQGTEDSTNATDGNTLRFTVRNQKDLARACEATRERLEERDMSTQTFQQRHDTDAGRMVLQRIHDETARAGAVCVAPKNLSASAEFISKHESAKLQEIHDICLQGGAKCAERGTSPFFSGSQPTLRDPRERAREHAERRNRQIRGESGAATPQAELSEPAPSTDPQEAAREQARAAARRHIERRNRQIEQEKKDIRDGKRPFHWRGR